MTQDLTRQLQQVRRKLETYEINGETQKDSTSLGSRTSSNGSLNNLPDNTSNQVVISSNNQVNHSRQSSPPEQVQVRQLMYLENK